MMRIGHGYDVHKLSPGYKFILGGVEIPYELGLKGHSDADVLVHAIMDSLLGAAGLPDIGNQFPDCDDNYKGISSLILLRKTGEILAQSGFKPINIDSTLICQKPKLAKYIPKMKENIASTLKMDIRNVNVKATTEENLGFTGRGEGIASHAVCLIDVGI